MWGGGMTSCVAGSANKNPFERIRKRIMGSKPSYTIRHSLNSILNYGRCKNKQISLIRVALLEGSVNNDLLVNYDADIINKY